MASEKSSDKGGAHSSQLIAKAGAIIELLSDSGPLTPAEVSEGIEEPRSSTYRLLKYMSDVGWIEQRSTGKWDVGVHLYRLSSKSIHRLDFTGAVRPFLERLHEQTRQTTYLCVLNRLNAVCIDRIEGLDVISLELRLGGALPLHVGAAPMSLLAFGGSALWERWEAQNAETGLQQFASASPGNAAQVQAKMQEIREKGYSISANDVTHGIAAIGAPVYDYTGEMRAAISLSGLSDSILTDSQRNIEAVLQAAQGASRALGHEKR